jgi:hypothetical protein
MLTWRKDYLKPTRRPNIKRGHPNRVDRPVHRNAVQTELSTYAATESLMTHLPGAAVADIDGPHLLLQSCPEECSAAVLKFMTAPQVLAWNAAPHFRGNAADENST